MWPRQLLSVIGQRDGDGAEEEMSIDNKYADISVRRRDTISIIEICRPEVRNALRRNTLEEIHSAVLTEIEKGARAVVLCGNPYVFSAGADLKELSTYTLDQREELQDKVWQPLLGVLEAAPVPILCAIRGYALGGGLELALACHMRVISESASLGFPEIKRGHMPSSGGTVRFPRLVNHSNALQHLLLGDSFNGREAYRIGLANCVMPDSEVLDHAIKLGEKIAQNSADSVRFILGSVMGGRDMPIEAAIRHEVDMSKKMRRSSRYASGWGRFEKRGE